MVWSNRPTESFDHVHVTIDSCAVLGGKPLAALEAWQDLARALHGMEERYPRIKLVITNQLLREQTNATDMGALMAMPGSGTATAHYIHRYPERVENYNTHVCRHFIKTLARDILSIRARPLIDRVEAGLRNGEQMDPDLVHSVAVAKAVMYQILWNTQRERALSLGTPPDCLAERTTPLPLYQLKELSEQFLHIPFLRDHEGELIPHPAVLTGIRNSALWPWNDAFFATPDRREKLRDLHYNCADLSMIDMMLRKSAVVAHDRPQLFMLVTHDVPLMRELLSFAYGLREVKQGVTSNQYRPLDASYNQLIESEHGLRRMLRKISRGELAVTDQEEMIRAVSRRIKSLSRERLLIRDKRERLLVKGTWHAYEMLEEEDYLAYSHRGLVVPRLPFEKIPNFLLLTAREFAMLLRKECDEIQRTLPLATGSLAADALLALQDSIDALQKEVRQDRHRFGKGSVGVRGLHRRLQRAAYQLLRGNMDALPLAHGGYPSGSLAPSEFLHH